MVKKYKKQRRRVEAKTAAQERIRSKRESNIGVQGVQTR